jgi:hypothetical protein
LIPAQPPDQSAREERKENKERRKEGMKKEIIKARGEDIRSPGGRAE